MPKSRKRKNQDFQKVKLKVGKKLPRGDNVTNLSFKTRQIQLTQKIRDGEGQDLVTRRKLSVQDLLRQCDHHSSSVRVNAVAGLKELWLSNHRELMELANVHGFGTILQKIAALFIDNESVVRHSVLGLFKVMLHKLSAISKTPPRGFPVLHIHTYLCCAMAHIHEDIKLDALLLFDVLMESFPSLLIHQTGDLLTNLLGFISAPISIGARADSTTQRLTLNPDSKLPIMKFRQRVLSRIKQIFQIAFEEMSLKVTREVKDVLAVPNAFHVYETIDTPLRQQDTYIRSEVDQRFQSLFSGACHELNNYVTHPPSLESFIKHSVPVLLHCWREARASVDSQPRTNNVISRDSSEVMTLVVHIIQLAFNLCLTTNVSDNANEEKTLVPQQILVDAHALEFEKLIICDFPYSLQVEASSSRKRKREKKNPAEDGPVSFSLDDLNLRLCDVMSTLSCSDSFEQKTKWMSRIEAHLIKVLGKKMNLEQAHTVVRAVRNLHKSNSIKLDSPVCCAAMDYFISCPLNTPQKRELFSLCTVIGRAWKKEELPSPSDQSHVINRIYSELPGLLLRVVKEHLSTAWAMEILSLMIHGHVQQSVVFMNSLIEHLTNLLDPAEGIPACQCEAVVERFFMLLSLGTPLGKAHYKQLLLALRRPASHPVVARRKSRSLVSHILQCLDRNIRELVPFSNQVEFHSMMAAQQDHLSEYLSFMVSLQIGFQKDELDERCPSGQNSENSPWQFVFDLDGDQWDRHTEISAFVSHSLCRVHIPASPAKGFPEPFTLISSIEKLWMKALTGRTKIHILTVCGLLQLVQQASMKHRVQKASPKLYSFTAQVLAYLLSCIHNREQTGLLAMDKLWQLKEVLVKTLRQDSPLLRQVWNALDRLTQESSIKDKTSLTTARDFLLSDASIKERLGTS